MPIVDLDSLVPEDVVFSYRGAEYVLPGDLEMEAVLELAQLLQKSEEAESSGDIMAMTKLNPRIKKFLLSLFQVRNADLTELPFGAIAYQHVIAEVLKVGGFVVEETPTPPAAPKKTAPPARSRRSTGSRK